VAVLRLLGRPAIGNRPLPADRRGGLLCYLAFSGEWMSRDQLSALFWPEADQASARRNLRQLLSRTKRLGDTEGLELTTDMARWQIVSDLSLFREAVAGSEWLLALERYYGDFLHGFTVDDSIGFDSWLSLERENLRNVYREAALRGAMLLENSGRHDEASKHLAAILDGDPLAEDVLQLYLRNLYLTGRRDSALQAYHRFERLLDDEVGMAPLRQTVELVQAIRAAQPLGTATPTGTGGNLQVPLQILRPPRLVGRELAVAAALSAATPLVVLTGEAGIGKSRMLEELAPQAPVLRCRESLAAVPFQPVVTLVRDYLDAGGERPELGSYQEDVARLLPELAADETPTVGALPEDKSRLLAALARLLEHIVAAKGSRPFGLVIDDLQWADNSTVELLGLLVDRGAMRILGAYRHDEPPEQLKTALRESRRAGKLVEVELHALTDADLVDLLAQLNDSPGTRPFGRWLHARTGGNPMFVLETLRSLHDAGRLPGADTSWQELADSLDGQELSPTAAVSDVVNVRVGRLSEMALRVLEAAAVVAEDLEPRLLAQICGLSEWAVADALGEAEVNGLISQSGFRHDLIRQSVYQAVPAGRIALLHGRTLEALASKPGRVSSALLARHATVARRGEDVVRYSLAAGMEALALPAYRDAVTHYRAALEAGPAPQARALALEGLGDALVQLYRCEEAQEAYEQAAHTLSSRDTPGLARLRRKSHLAYARSARDDLAIQALVEARALLEADHDEGSNGWRHEWIEVMLAIAGWHYALNELEQMASAVEAVGQAAVRHGTPGQQSRYYGRVGMLASRRERYRVSEATLELGKKALAVLRGSGDLRLIASQRFSLGFLALWRGDLPLAREQLLKAAAFAAGREEITMQMQTHTYLAIMSRQEVDLEETETHAALALDLATRHRKLDFEAAALANQGWLRLMRGDQEGALAASRAALETWHSTRVVSYPFYWLACAPLLAIAMATDDLELAAEQARLLLQPSQLRLADDLTDALRGGLAAFSAADYAGARPRLQQALDLAGRDLLT